VAVDPELGIKGLPYVWVFLAIFVEIVFWTTRVNFYDLDMYNFGPTGRTIVHKLVAVGTVIILPLLPIILYIGLNRLRYAKEER
jgi:hypothetical protein